MADQPDLPPATAGSDQLTNPHLHACAALTALKAVAARFESLIAAIETRPGTETPYEALAALISADEGQVLATGPDEGLALALLDSSPSLAGRFFWKAQAIIDRLAIDFGRREGIPHTDLRPQLQAAAAAAAFHAALRSWVASPAGPTLEELTQQALAQVAEGLGPSPNEKPPASPRAPEPAEDQCDKGPSRVVDG